MKTRTPAKAYMGKMKVETDSEYSVEIIDEKECAIASLTYDFHPIGGRTIEEAEANAQRIVKAVNMHNELINVIKALLEDNTHLELNLDSVEKAEELLKQAEQK